MKVLKNCFFAVKTVWHYAPVRVLVFLVSQLVPGTFAGLQILLQKNLVDSACAWAQGAGALEPAAAWGGAYVAMLILWVTIQRVGNYQGKVIDLTLKERMAPDIMDRLMKLEYADFERQGTQELFQRMSREPQKDIGDVFSLVVNTLMAIVSAASIMAVYFTVSPWIGAGSLFLGVPLLFLAWQAARGRKQFYRGVTDEKRRLADLKRLLADKDAMYEMKLFSADKLLTDKWGAYNKALEQKNRQEGRRMVSLEMASYVLRAVYYVFMTAVLGYSFLGGTVSLGQFTAAFGNVHKVIGRIHSVGNRVSDLFQRAVLLDFYREFEALPDREDLGEIDQTQGKDIVFEHVSFRYPGTEREILRDVSFRIREGEHIAFVGENGAGKSTLIKLMLGLYAPTEGRVTIGGTPVRELTARARQGLLSVVFQDYCNYQMTLRENIAFGGIGALKNDAKLLSALEAAGGGALVEGVEKGLDRNLGKLAADGQDLSGGQWQRVAMARAFVSDAAWVVLDEPTAALDPIAESRMYENFSRIFAERSVLLISHRLASARLADRILVLDGGHIVQDGNHEELMGQEGLYRLMYSAQSSFYAEVES